MTRISSFVLLSLLPYIVCIGCSDDQAGAPASTEGQVIETGDAETPYFTVGTDGRVVWFHANPTTGAPSGISMMMPDGREGYLAIDEETAEPLYWTAEGWIVTFSNWRLAEGLVDVGFIGPDGTATRAADVEFPPLEAGTFSPFDGSQKADTARWRTFLSALTTTLGGAVCAGSVIITAGTAVAGVTFPPGGVPLFAASWTGTAWVCGSTVVGVLALNPENTTAVDTNEVLTPLNAANSVRQCVGARDFAACVLALGDSVSAIGNQLARDERAEVERLRHTEPPDLTVFCCTGLSRIEDGQEGTWSAIALGDASPPFAYGFNWGDLGGDIGTGSTSNVVFQEPHTYDSGPGTYPIVVAIEDASGVRTDSSRAAPGAHPTLAPYTVEVHEPLTVSLNVQSSSSVGEEVGFMAFFSGGERPIWWVVEYGDGSGHGGRTAADAVDRLHTYARAGEYEIRFEAQNGDGEVLAVETATITVAGVTAPPDPACHDAKYHLCENIRGQGCDASTMDRAVGRIRDACGGDETSRFVGVAELYCAVTGMGSFTEATCAEQ